MKGELLINQIYAYSQIEVPSPAHCAVPTPAHYVVNPRSLNNFFFLLIFSANFFLERLDELCHIVFAEVSLLLFFFFYY